MRYFHRIRVVVSGLTCREIERTALETQEKRECPVICPLVCATPVSGDMQTITGSMLLRQVPCSIAAFT